MKRILQFLRLKFHFSWRKLGSVEQFTAVLLVIGIFTLGAEAWAQKTCGQVMREILFQSPKFDDAAFARSWYANLHKYGKVVPGKVTVTDFEGQSREIKTPAELKIQMDPQKNFDIGLMGILAKIYDLKWDQAQGKTNYKENEFYYKQVREKTAEALAKASPKDLTPEFMKIVEELLALESLSSETSLIHFKKTLYKEEDVFPEISKAIESRFRTRYIHVVNWAYRQSGLEKNKGLSSATMVDEILTLLNEGKALHLHLAYDNQVLNAELRIIQLKVEEYHQAKTPEERKKILDSISDPMEPFLPFAGVASAISFVEPNAPVELKRYFKNLLEDPLKLVGVSDKSEYHLRHKLLRRAVELLPAKTLVEVHAHREDQSDNYLKLGFQKKGIISNPKYPGVKVYLMQASREEVMAALQVILNKSR